MERSGLNVVGEAADVGEALAVVADRHPQVLLLDLHMPGGPIEAAIREIASAGQTRVLVLTGDQQASAIRAALQAGAAGYVPKNARPHELLEAVGRVADGDEYVSPTLGASLVDRRSARLAAVPRDDVEVLRLTALGHTAKEIAERLGSTPSQVEWQRKRAQRALGARTRAEVVRIALDEGLVVPRPEPPGT